MAVDIKGLFSAKIVDTFFLFFHKMICCGYSLEVFGRGISNDYSASSSVPKFSSFLWEMTQNDLQGLKCH